MSLKVVATQALPDPPYSPAVRARGWRFELDLERVHQSITWKRCPPELRPWLYMIWTEAWLQAPIGTLPDDDDDIAAIIGMSVTQLQVHRQTLLRGWVKHADGLLYHRVLTELVLEMIGSRKRDRDRKHLKNNDSSGFRRPPMDSSTGTGTGTGKGVSGFSTEPKGVEKPETPRAARAALPCPHQKIVDLYHELLPDNPKVVVVSEERQRVIRARWREWSERRKYGDPPTEARGLDFWRRYFAFAAKSPFLTGRSAPKEDGRDPFKADFDFLIGARTHLRVVEGKYHEEQR